jgi:hypothetical protein
MGRCSHECHRWSAEPAKQIRFLNLSLTIIHDIQQCTSFLTEKGEGAADGAFAGAGTSKFAGGHSRGRRARKREPSDPLAPAPFRQGGLKATPPTEQKEISPAGCRKAGAVTVRRAGAASADLPKPLRWQHWAGSILPAWRAELERWPRGRILAAVLSVDATGRADLVLRVEEDGQVVLTAARERAKGLRDPSAAMAWGTRAVRDMAGAMSGGECGERLATGRLKRENAGMERSSRAAAPAASEPGSGTPPAAAAALRLSIMPYLLKMGHETGPQNGHNGTTAHGPKSALSTIYDIHCIYL